VSVVSANDLILLREYRRRSTARPSVAAPSPECAEFIRDHVVIDDAQGGGDGTMPFVLWPAQEELLHAITTERQLLILKARQLGISWLCCAYALWLCLFHPGKVVLAFSKGQDEANELTRRVTVMFDRLGAMAGIPALIKQNTEELVWANGSRFKSMPATPSAGRTFTASLAIMDEAAFMAYADRLYTAMKPTIDGGGQLIILSTANGKSNLFYTLIERAQAGLGSFAFRFLPWHVRPGRDQAWYDATAADAIDDGFMKQEYPATPDEAFEATDVSTFLPSISLWDACTADIPPLDPHMPVILAMDAGESSDTFATCLVSRWGEGLALRYSRIYTPKGSPLNFDAIEQDIRGLVSRFAVQQIAYDPMLLGQMMRRLSAPGRAIPVPLEPFPQGSARLEGDKLLLDLITQRRIAHDGTHAETRQHLANADKKVDSEGRRLRIVKRQHSLKVDGAVCLAMGAARALEVLSYGTGFALTYDDRARPQRRYR